MYVQETCKVNKQETCKRNRLKYHGFRMRRYLYLLLGDLPCSLLDLCNAFSSKQWVGIYFLEKFIRVHYSEICNRSVMAGARGCS